MATTRKKSKGKASAKPEAKGKAKAVKPEAKGKAKAVKPAAKAKAKAAKPAAKAKAKVAKPAAKAEAKVAKPAAKARRASRSSGAIHKVAFTLFPVEDFVRARAFYEDTLGLSRGLASDSGTWTEYDLPGGGCLALFCHPQFAGKPGGASIAFEVTDLDALNQRLQAAGVSYRGDMVHGPNCRMSNIIDSEGNGIILHQLNAKR